MSKKRYPSSSVPAARTPVAGGILLAALAGLGAPAPLWAQSVSATADPGFSASPQPGPFLSIRKEDNTLILIVNGDMDLYNAYKVKEAVLAMIEKGFKDVKIDLGACAYIDSSGIGSLLTCHSSMKKAGGRLRLSRLRTQVYRVIELTKLITYFEIVDTVQPSPLGTIELDDLDFED